VAPASTDAAAAALDTQAAAASALGALAAGLAASSLGSSKMPEQGPTFPAPDQPKRAIEDIVTDMVRPMLEKWIAENMPRIVEKALRGEAKSKKV
jgi:cell pole-organizing protein PopZ